MPNNTTTNKPIPSFIPIPDEELPTYAAFLKKYFDIFRSEVKIPGDTNLNIKNLWKDNIEILNKENQNLFNKRKESPFLTNFVDDVASAAKSGSIQAPFGTFKNNFMMQTKTIIEAPSKIKSSNNSRQTQNLPSVSLPLVQPIPKLSFWLPVQRNIVVEDEIRTRCLPFFGDHDCSNQAFYTELLKLEEQKIKEQNEEKKYLDNSEIKQILLKMILKFSDKTTLQLADAIVRAADYDNKNKVGLSSSLNSTSQIYINFIESLEIRKNVERYVLMGISRKRIKEENEFYYNFKLKQVENDIEKVFVGQFKNASHKNYLKTRDLAHFIRVRASVIRPEKFLSTYHDLYCPRCHKFDCFDHHQMPRPPVHAYKSKIRYELPKMHPVCYIGDSKGADRFTEEDLNSCENSCFIKLTENDLCDPFMKENLISILSNLRKCNHDSIFTSGKEDLVENFIKIILYSDNFDSSVISALNWSQNQASFYDATQKLFRFHFCHIAKIIRKPCQEVMFYFIFTTLYNHLMSRKIIEAQQKTVLENGHNSLSESIDFANNSQFSQDGNGFDASMLSIDPLADPTSPVKKKIKKTSFAGNHRNNNQMSATRKLLAKQNSRNRRKSGGRRQYFPCDCYIRGLKICDKECSNVVTDNFCEKGSACLASCQNRYPGCQCSTECTSKQCPCYNANRECDPDVCKCCMNLNEVVHCNNNQIQRGLKQRIIMAPSRVAGWGAYAANDIPEINTLISEYCGEMITQEEAERRGRVYDKNMCSYLFDLNSDYAVDAMRKGNKIRFANHSSDNFNIKPKVMMVNGDHRIGLYNIRPIRANEELFFNYKYNDEYVQQYVPKINRSTVGKDIMGDSDGPKRGKRKASLTK